MALSPGGALAQLESELLNVLQSSRTVSASRVSSITRLAMLNAGTNELASTFGKAIVSFIRNSPPNLKLSGLYIIDSICRAAITESRRQISVPEQAELVPFVSYFTRALPPLTQQIQRTPAADKERILRLINVWREHKLFAPDFLDKAESKWVTNVPCSAGVTSSSGINVNGSMQQAKGQLNRISYNTTDSKPQTQVLPVAGPSFPQTNTDSVSSQIEPSLPVFSHQVDPSKNVGTLPNFSATKFFAPLFKQQFTVPLPNQSNGYTGPNVPPQLLQASIGSLLPTFIQNPIMDLTYKNDYNQNQFNHNQHQNNFLPTYPQQVIEQHRHSRDLGNNQINSNYYHQGFQEVQKQQHDANYHMEDLQSFTIIDNGNNIGGRGFGKQSNLREPHASNHANITNRPRDFTEKNDSNRYSSSLNRQSKIGGNTNNKSRHLYDNDSENFEEYEDRITPPWVSSQPIVPSTGWAPLADQYRGTGGSAFVSMESNPRKDLAPHSAPPIRLAGPWVQVSGGCRQNEIKVLSRTLFASGFRKPLTELLIIDIFGTYGHVEKVNLKHEENVVLFKLRTRKMANEAKRAIHGKETHAGQIEVEWACDFGSPESFDINTGVSVLQVKNFSENEIHCLLNSRAGGIRDSGPLRGGLTIEEPDPPVMLANSQTSSLFTNNYNGNNNNN